MKTIRRPRFGKDPGLGAGPRTSGFTLLELLVVIGLIGLMTFIAIPAFKGFGQANKLALAQRQITDDLGRARQFAIQNRAPVFLVFFAPADPLSASTSFPSELVNNNNKWVSLRSTPLGDLALRTITNVYAGLNASYAFYTEQALGDQPGVLRKRYLSFSGSIWRFLPEGIIFAPFMTPYISLNNSFTNLATRDVPFPVADQFPGMTHQNPLPTLRLPVLAFDAQGRLTELDSFGNLRTDARRVDRYVAIGLGTVILPRRAVTDTPNSGVKKQANDFDFSRSVDVLETPHGNYTNSFYRVQALTGRARKQSWPLF